MRRPSRLFFALIVGSLFLPGLIALAQTNKPTCRITITPTQISPGGSITLKWTSTNATGGAITGVGNVGPEGSKNLLPSTAAQTTYYGSFTGTGGTANCQATVRVTYGTGDGATVTSDGVTVQNAGTVSTNVTLTTSNTSGSSGSTNTNTQTNTSALVQCGLSSNPLIATGCQACHLAQLIQNIINFAIGLSIPIAAALFAYAGVLLFTSADNPGRRDQAKKIFKNAFIGFLIAITGWLVINTVLHVLLGQGKVFSGGNWFTIQCVADDNDTRPRNTTISDLISSLTIFGGSGTVDTYGNGTTGYSSSQVYDNSTGGTLTYNGQYNNSYNCDRGYVLDTVDEGTSNEYNACVTYAEDGTISDSRAVRCTTGTHLSGSSDYSSNDYSGECVNNITNQVVEVDDTTAGSGGSGSGGGTGGGRGTTMCSESNTNCSVSSLQSTDPDLSDAEARTLSCIAMTESSGITGRCSGTGPCGIFQITRTNWNLYAPDGCRASDFGGDIVAAQNNVRCNTLTALELYEENGYQPWTGNNNGVYWNTAARRCVQNYDPTQLDL